MEDMIATHEDTRSEKILYMLHIDFWKAFHMLVSIIEVVKPEGMTRIGPLTQNKNMEDYILF